MPDFSWLAEEQALSSAALTVRAQTISPNDNGALLWDGFMPRLDVDSVDLSDISTIDYRPTADRREWNARGRYIPIVTPAMRDIKIVPIEAYHTIEEQEIQKLAERTIGNQERFREIIGASIPDRVDMLVQANYRRIELDAMTAWATGQIVQKNPQSGQTFTSSFGFDAGRYQTAATAWDDSGLNAYDEFIAWLEDAVNAIGPVAGAVMRLATFKAIQADAPQGVNAVRLTRLQVEDRISQDMGSAFRFYIVENTLSVFNDGGTARTATKIWPAEVVAAVPVGQRVGVTAFAPVVRAIELDRVVPAAKVDIRGQTAYHMEANGGRELTIEAQVNALPVPDEQRLFVIDAGV